MHHCFVQTLLKTAQFLKSQPIQIFTRLLPYFLAEIAVNFFEIPQCALHFLILIFPQVDAGELLITIHDPLGVGGWAAVVCKLAGAGEHDDGDLGVAENGELLGLLHDAEPSLGVSHLPVGWVLYLLYL